MSVNVRKSLASVLVAGSCLLGCTVFGAGYQLYTEGSAEALGMGGAMSARRDMVSNAWYNPASLAGYEKTSLMLGVTLADITYTYDTEIGNLRDAMEDDLHFIPHLHYVRPLTEKLNLTLSVTAPYGLGTSWDSDFVNQLLDARINSGNTVFPNKNFVEEISLEAFYLTPSLAYSINDSLSVAAGISIVYGHFYMKPALLFPGPTKVRPDYEGEGIGLSGVLAANYRPNENWTIGLKYQSEAKLDMTGDTDGDPRAAYPSDDIEGTVTLPPTITLGVANTSIDRWTFGLDVIWTGWSTYDELRIENDRANGNPALIPSEKDWNDVFQYRIGAEYELSEAWRLRCGYVFDESPIEEDTRGMELPGNDRHMFCLGVGYIAESWSLDVGYSYLMVDDSDAGTIPLADQGEFYGGEAHLLSCSLTMNF